MVRFAYLWRFWWLVAWFPFWIVFSSLLHRFFFFCFNFIAESFSFFIWKKTTTKIASQRNTREKSFHRKNRPPSPKIKKKKKPLNLTKTTKTSYWRWDNYGSFFLMYITSQNQANKKKTQPNNQTKTLIWFIFFQVKLKIVIAKWWWWWRKWSMENH